jgi:hypothetical protein
MSVPSECRPLRHASFKSENNILSEFFLGDSNMVSVLATVNYIYFRKIANFSITKTLNVNYNSKINALKLQDFQRRIHISPRSDVVIDVALAPKTASNKITSVVKSMSN